MTEKKNLLSSINSYEDFKQIHNKSLPSLASEIRDLIIELGNNKSIHLGSNLGIVEVTLAIAKVFNLEHDLVFFDTGHQSYVHKIITGRRSKIDTIRETDGLYGLQNMNESKFDHYSGGHAGNSLSVAAGYLESIKTENEATIRRRQKLFDLIMRFEQNPKKIKKITKLKEVHSEVSSKYVVPIIGDAAIANGIAMEALNDISFKNQKAIIVINDNGMSISESVGSIPKAISKLKTNKALSFIEKSLYSLLWNTTSGKKIYSWMYRSFHRTSNFFSGNNLFSALGYQYIGPIDGHNIKKLMKALEKAKWYQKFQPVILHVKTQKGKGLKNAASDKVGLNHSTNVDDKTKMTGEYLAEHLMAHIVKNPKIKVINPAMTYNSGFLAFSQINRENYFDVGIAEEHAISFASGLAIRGMIPVVAIYSSFLQRTYDQLLHDVSRLNLGLTLLIDRAEICGGDGDSHHGIYDVGFLKTIPNTIIACPANIWEACMMLDQALLCTNKIYCIRYPKKLIYEELPIDEQKRQRTLINNLQWTYEIDNPNYEKVVVTYGKWVNVFKELIKKQNMPINLVNARFINGHAHSEVLGVLKRHKSVCIFEEIYGDLGLANDFQLLNSGLSKLITKNIKNFPGAGNNKDLYVKNNLDAEKTLKELMNA